MRHKRAWTMPAEEARTFLQRIQEKIASSDIEVPHRDVLIRLRSIIEEDLEAEFERSVESRQSAGTRCAAAVNHSFIASVQASQWGGVAYSPAIRPRPLGPRQGGALPAGFAESREGRSRDEAPGILFSARSASSSRSSSCSMRRSWRPEVLCNLLGHRRSCAPGRRRSSS